MPSPPFSLAVVSEVLQKAKLKLSLPALLGPTDMKGLKVKLLERYGTRNCCHTVCTQTHHSYDASMFLSQMLDWENLFFFFIQPALRSKALICTLTRQQSTGTHLRIFEFLNFWTFGPTFFPSVVAPTAYWYSTGKCFQNYWVLVPSCSISIFFPKNYIGMYFVSGQAWGLKSDVYAG